MSPTQSPRALDTTRPTAPTGSWTRERPPFGSAFASDVHAAAEFVAAAHEVLASVPAKPDRDAAEQALAAEVLASCRTLREEFLRRHVTQVYDELTAGRSRLRRLDDLVYGAAEAYPWLVPDRATTETERANRQADKEGYECDQALFVAAVLDEPQLGEHLIRAMLRPTREAVETLDYFRAHGEADLGCVRVDRRDGIGHVTVQNDRYLNAEDDAVIAALELAVDLVLLDDGCRVGVLRGGPVSHPRYRGKRVFSAGINLTHLYYGQISYIDFLMRRELGPMHKMYRGHWLGDRGAGGEWETREKPWIGAVDTFAIGGGLQMLLVTDRVVADNRAYFSLPALREGIVPGTGSLRINRFVGDRLARQLIFADRRIDADEPEARLLCDRIVEPAAMDGEIAAQAESLAGRAVIGNRRMARLAQEPVSLFRRYLAAYSREQMTLLYSDELVSKLEKGWLDRRRGG